jgi:benzil reductase ((S)-benzoin forming)
MSAPLQLTILTGASRGLGRAIAQALLATPGQYLVCISRKSDQDLSACARVSGSVVEQWMHDLADAMPVADRLTEFLVKQEASRFASAMIVNNAGVMAPPRPLGMAQADDLVRSLRVGLEAPLLLTAAFLRGTRDWEGSRKIVHMSSGLGSMARGGQVPYCAVKAGLDHSARALALEAAAQPNGARAVALYPGIVDTDMQEELRNADPSQFPDVTRFQMLKDKGMLEAPAVTAGKVLAWIARNDFGVDPVVDLMKI